MVAIFQMGGVLLVGVLANKSSRILGFTVSYLEVRW